MPVQAEVSSERGALRLGESIRGVDEYYNTYLRK
jgi:hypothetical protein